MKHLLVITAALLSLAGCGIMGSDESTHAVRFVVDGEATSAYVLYGIEPVLTHVVAALPWEATINGVRTGESLQLEALSIPDSVTHRASIYVDGELIEAQTVYNTLIRFDL